MKTRQYIYKKKNPKSRDFCFCCAARSHRSPQRLTSSDGFSLPPTDLFPHPHFIRHFLSFFFLLLLLLSVRPQYIAVVIRQSTSFFSPFIDCYRPIKRRKSSFRFATISTFGIPNHVDRRYAHQTVGGYTRLQKPPPLSPIVCEGVGRRYLSRRAK